MQETCCDSSGYPQHASDLSSGDPAASPAFASSQHARCIQRLLQLPGPQPAAATTGVLAACTRTGFHAATHPKLTLPNRIRPLNPDQVSEWWHARARHSP